MFPVGVVLLLLLTTLLAALLIWRWRHFSYFENLGIPGPKPNLIWGNIREYHSKELYKVITKWLDKYGDVFGFYNGDVPFVVTRDLDFIEYVFVRNFHNFVDRGMMPYIEEDAGIFVKYLEEHADSGQEVHMLRKLEELTMDYEARGSFGIDERFQGRPDHPLTALARSAFRGTMKGPFHMIAQCTTTLGALMKPLYWLSLLLEEYTFHNLNMQTAKVVQLRKRNPAFRKADILQNLIDAEYIEDNMGSHDKKTSKGGLKRRALRIEEIITSASVLFIAGFDTTATALSYVFFCLAKHPDVQERLRREIIGTVGSNDSLDYDTVMKRLKYLHYVVDEALRLYPPGLTFLTRQAKEDFEYKGIKFRAGTCFMAAQYQTQTDPRYWTNPLEFNPDRFAPENETAQTKAANIPFGVGPRNCVGKRMAMLKMRYTVARLLQKYRFELGQSQMGSMELGQYGSVSTPSRGPWILIHSLAEELRRN